MRPSECDFTVPERLFPLSPPELRGERRDHVRPAVLDRSCTRLEHGRFDKLGSYLREGDVLVVNNTKMVHDQLRGQTSRGPVRLVLFGHHVDGWHAAVSPASRGARGLVVRIGGDELRGVLVRRTFEDMWLVKFEHDGDFYELLERHGERNVPLYKPLRDQQQTYLNVYTTEPGSLEIRSAGLHFTREMLERLERRGVRIVPITLHIGLTELQSHRHIVEENVEDHEVGSEWYRVRPSAARAINGARRAGGRIVAVGTSVVRTLESVATEAARGPRIEPGEGWTDLFIYPGHRYTMVDAMLTNLHEPQSSHLLLVAAFAGKQFTLESDAELLRDDHRFDLFGDSMLIVWTGCSTATGRVTRRVAPWRRHGDVG